MATQIEIIAELKTLIQSLNYTVFETDISEKDLADTQLPAVIISTVATAYAQQVQRYGWVEEYTIGMIIKLQASTNNLSSLVMAQRSILDAIMTSIPLRKLLAGGSITPKTSNASNAIAQHSPNGSKAITCILSISCQTVQGV